MLEFIPGPNILFHLTNEEKENMGSEMRHTKAYKFPNGAYQKTFYKKKRACDI